MANEVVVLKGLDEFQRSIRILLTKVPTEVVQDAGKEAAEITIRGARPLVPVRSGRTVSTLSAQATATGGIAEGGEGIEWYGWLEFGGTSGRHGSNERERVVFGRYIYPSYEANSDEIDRASNEALIAVFRRAGVEVTPSYE